MDEGSTISLIDVELAKRINVKGVTYPLKITCVGSTGLSDPQSQLVTFGVSALDSSVVYNISKARTIRNLNLFSQSMQEFDIKDYQHLLHLPIEYYTDAKPLILIGQDHWNLISPIQIRCTTRNEPAASLTRLGWVVHGQILSNESQEENVYSVNEDGMTVDKSTSEIDLNTLVKANFALESIGITNFNRKNKLEERAESILSKTARYLGNQWEVGLLWKDDIINLPDNRNYALSRLVTLERKMDKNPEYSQRYCKEVEKLIDSKYAKKLPSPIEKNSRTWYLPHFGTTNPNKPEKLRLVFDAAVKTGGTSLNDHLMTGPDLVNSLLGVLIRFRQGRIAFKADIREMFLQIKICENDQNAQRFLWRGMERNREPDTYVMTSMFFGAASSPFTAQYIMRRNALEMETQHPQAVSAILRKHYVDDYLDSVNTVEEAIERIQTVSSIQKRGGFELRGWTSNCKQLLEKISNNIQPEQIINLSAEQTIVERTLGLNWNPSYDTISLDLNRVSDEVSMKKKKPTKREMLRVIMSVYDPLGISLPFTIKGKILLQDVWRSNIGWDEELHDEEFSRWQQWTMTLNQIKSSQIQRAYCGERNSPESVELHLFSDASDKAYAAVAYLRAIYDQDLIITSFIAGKARVAPLKPVSIPRLELQGALMASRLGQTISEELEIKITKRTFWTDSYTVLGWIQADPKRYQTFVAHRLGEIDELTNSEDWKWIASKQNPADCSTKSTGNVVDLMDKWLNGPEFLRQRDSEWPKQPKEKRIMHPKTEEKKEFTAAIIDETTYESPKIENFSKWLCLIRSTAILLISPEVWRGQAKPEITSDWMQKAEEHLTRKVQQECFLEEIRALKLGQTLPNGSRLRNLNPIITKDDGILKIDGRISAVEQTSASVKNPAILDGKHRYTRLLIQQYHQRFHHGSNETVVNELKQKYWILKIRPTVKSVSAQCVLCRLRRGKTQQPRMGDLPPARLGHHCRPFSFCGLDYFGPMEVTVGRRREKRWGALFTCLTTRAVHLELVTSLSTDSAIMALQRMSNRRGTPSEIFSDNATNFKGAQTELKNAIKGIDQNRMMDEATNLGIKWRFIPPLAPHMGGAWERLVKSVKNSLAVILKERAPKEEILRTLFTEAEYVVNCRPLTTVSVDPRDKEALTPNHYLMGSSSGSVVQGEFTANDLCQRKQWRIAQRLADMFWARWLKEYLPNLVVRKCWNQETRNLREGDVVLIADATLPRNIWPKGQITKVFPGKDGRVRVVDVRCRGKTFKRAANKIVVLIPSSSDAEVSHSRIEGEDVTDGRDSQDANLH